jgi:hypothetical protein
MTPKDMMVVDANADAMGILRTSLMENAGRCLANRIIQNMLVMVVTGVMDLYLLDIFLIMVLKLIYSFYLIQFI